LPAVAVNPPDPKAGASPLASSTIGARLALATVTGAVVVFCNGTLAGATLSVPRAKGPAKDALCRVIWAGRRKPSGMLAFHRSGSPL
jgi:hypothetical protein